eukprot:8977414-Ditylum_brightwellii.AAC.1
MTLHEYLQGTISSQLRDFTCLEVESGKAENGAILIMAKCDGTQKQKWRVDTKEGLIYSGLTEGKENDEDKKCLDLRGGNKQNGATLQLYKCYKGHKNMMWQYYNNILSLAADNKYVIDHNLSSDRVALYSYNGNLNQRFLT